MKSVVRPELSTAAAGPSQAPTAAVDNSAPLSTTRSPLINRGKLFKQPGPLLQKLMNVKLSLYPISVVGKHQYSQPVPEFPDMNVPAGELGRAPQLRSRRRDQRASRD